MDWETNKYIKPVFLFFFSSLNFPKYLKKYFTRSLFVFCSKNNHWKWRCCLRQNKHEWQLPQSFLMLPVLVPHRSFPPRPNNPPCSVLQLRPNHSAFFSSSINGQKKVPQQNVMSLYFCTFLPPFFLYLFFFFFFSFLWGFLPYKIFKHAEI